MSEPRGAIVIGASSGIGEALARELAAEGYRVGLAARRTERLKSIGEELPTKAYVATMDVTDAETARERFFGLAEAMGRVELVVISAGIGRVNRELEWERQRQVIETNVTGFAALASAAVAYFEERAGAGGEASDGHESSTEAPAGHLVGISSIAAHVGIGALPAYGASKAFVSNYLEGLRYRQSGRGADVTITTVEPGYVDTRLSVGEFWRASPESTAKQIARAIRRERRHVYVTRRWRLVAWWLKAMPERVLQWLLR
ncbi:SDR family NAD(P)-dependent oxidoreductase [Halobacteria archaeon AArc-dxtr1]|nr:SDR family NAD(P)-dependent oxidoreductase [Halobacteria archaeon AArc-dxtr1]